MRNPATRSLTVVFMLLALVACSTDTPTAPERTPAPPPGSGPTTAWNISITVQPRNLTANAAQPATVTVQVRRASDGAAPLNGTTAVVSASLGDFNSSASGTKTVTVSLSGGVAQLLYFAGALLGTDTIQAQLETSVGSAVVNILEADVLFLQSVEPSSGPEGGGTRIRISGTGFSEPARVTLGTGTTAINATVDAVGRDSLGEFIRAFTGPVFDPTTFFGEESCDTDGDGTTDGRRFLPVTVGVTVTFTDGSATLANAFTYRPSDTSCRDITPDPDRPRAKFSFTVNLNTVLFNNESTPNGNSYNWIFGDGVGASTAESPVYTYPGSVCGPPDLP
ncbi:MAG: IPT/TIG domain-containing protein, partial [Thermoanaerobaculia bacterium]